MLVGDGMYLWVWFKGVRFVLDDIDGGKVHYFRVSLSADFSAALSIVEMQEESVMIL